MSAGSVSGTTCAPSAGLGEGPYGWYRLYLYDGPAHLRGLNFCVIRSNANFVANPPVGTPATPALRESPTMR